METHRQSDEQIVHSERPGFPTSKTVHVVAFSHRLRSARESGTESGAANRHSGSCVGFAVRVGEVADCGTGDGGEILAAARHGTLEGRIIEVRQNIVLNGVKANGHARCAQRRNGVTFENSGSGDAGRQLTHAALQVYISLADLRQASSVGLGHTQQRRSSLRTVGDEQRFELLEPIGSKAMQEAS